MFKTEWSITSFEDWFEREDFLFSYAPMEQAYIKTQLEHAKLVLTPKFIPYYPKLAHDWLSQTATLLFWFLDFFLSSNKRFFCTNDQLAELLDVSERTIANVVKELKDKWLITCSMKTFYGWSMRIIKITDKWKNALWDIK